MRLSFGWVVTGFIVIILLGIAGGFVGQKLSRPILPPLTSDSNQIVSTMQSVTISPNTAVTEIVAAAERSVLLLGPARSISERTTIASGFVVTNDGLLVSASGLPAVDLTAYDGSGRNLRLERIGDDPLFGLTYFKIPDNVVVPLDVRKNDSEAGEQLFIISRDRHSFKPTVVPYFVNNLEIPGTNTPKGLQRIMTGTKNNAPLIRGAPLLDDNEKLAGIVIDPEAGIVVPVNHVLASVSRITKNQREQDQFVNLGLGVTYGFVSSDQQAVKFGVTVSSVVPQSPSGLAGIQRGDLLLQVNGTDITWNQPLISLLAQELPMRLTLSRAGEHREVILKQVAELK